MCDLMDLARKWGTDKAKYYADFYEELLGERRHKVRNVLEIGIGYPELMRDYATPEDGGDYKTGASLFMWAEYFPWANIYGLDHNPAALFSEPRITTFYLEEKSESSWTSLFANVSLPPAFDLIIDDGCHEADTQIQAFERLAPFLNRGGIYIVEDVVISDKNKILSALRELIGFHAAVYPMDFGEACVIVAQQQGW